MTSVSNTPVFSDVLQESHSGRILACQSPARGNSHRHSCNLNRSVGNCGGNVVLRVHFVFIRALRLRRKVREHISHHERCAPTTLANALAVLPMVVPPSPPGHRRRRGRASASKRK